MEHLPATRELVKFSLKCYQSNLNDALSDKIKSLIFDQIGLQIGCATLPWSRTTYSYLSRLFPVQGRSTIAYYGDRVNPEQAAFSNACFGHAQDFDDTCLKVQTHPGAVIIPVALAIAEETGASGLQVMKAVAAGMEVMLRVAHSVSPGCLQRGHHTPQATGPFGSAITAGLLLGLNEEQLLNAMGIAGSFSGGLIEYTQSGGSVKRIHTAIPTTAGIRAAYFAADGMTGPATVLEGKKGFCTVYSDTTDLCRLTDRLHERYLIHDVALKYYNCCYFIHAPLEATLELTQEYELTPDKIKRIRVGTSRHGTVHVGRIKEPHDSLGAQFSVQYTLALALLKEIPGLESYEQNLWDADIRRYASKVEVFEDPICTAEYPENWGSIVEIETHDGCVMSRRVRFPIGNPENPMSDDAIRSKFMRNVTGKISRIQAETLCDKIASLYSVQDIKELTSLLVAPGAQNADAAKVKGLAPDKYSQATTVLQPVQDEGLDRHRGYCPA
jgi:2-methylcitrate dehydratase PrpD